MSIIAKASESNFKKLALPEAGTTPAVCCGVWDIGLQESTFNNETKVQHKIVIAWEIAQLIDDAESEYNGKPYMLSNKYTLSLDDRSNLHRDLVAWRGKPFTDEEIDKGVDLEKLYGINCLLNIIHRETATGTYANIASIMPMVKGSEKMTPLRTKDEPAPKWVLNLAENAVQPVPTGADADAYDVAGYPDGDGMPDFMKD